MYDFQNYKRLDRDCQGLSSNFWALHLLKASGNSSPEKLCSELALRNVKVGLKPRMLRQKLLGEPIKQLSKVERVDGVFPGTANVLNHPLWQLLDRPHLDRQELLTLARQLPYRYAERLLNKTMDDFKIKKYVALVSDSNLHLLCLVLIERRLKEIEDKGGFSDDSFDHLITRILIRMFSVIYPKSTNLGFKLCEQIAEVLIQENKHWVTPEFVLPDLEYSQNLINVADFPWFVSEIRCASDFKKYCLCYSIILNVAKLKYPKYCSDKNQLHFLSALPNSEFHQVAWEMCITNESGLSKLDYRSYLQRALYSIIQQTDYRRLH